MHDFLKVYSVCCTLFFLSSPTTTTSTTTTTTATSATIPVQQQLFLYRIKIIFVFKTSLHLEVVRFNPLQLSTKQQCHLQHQSLKANQRKPTTKKAFQFPNVPNVRSVFYRTFFLLVSGELFVSPRMVPVSLFNSN